MNCLDRRNQCCFNYNELVRTTSQILSSVYKEQKHKAYWLNYAINISFRRGVKNRSPQNIIHTKQTEVNTNMRITGREYRLCVKSFV